MGMVLKRSFLVGRYLEAGTYRHTLERDVSRVCLCIVGTDNKIAILAFSKGNNLHVVSIFLFLSSGS